MKKVRVVTTIWGERFCKEIAVSAADFYPPDGDMFLKGQEDSITVGWLKLKDS
ncbi:MAG: hypothetical protein IID17_14460 [Nitrospinae bacterium]|nr:hypothetical protein [Nitrospinota bacterium]